MGGRRCSSSAGAKDDDDDPATFHVPQQRGCGRISAIQNAAASFDSTEADGRTGGSRESGCLLGAFEGSDLGTPEVDSECYFSGASPGYRDGTEARSSDGLELWFSLGLALGHPNLATTKASSCA